MARKEIVENQIQNVEAKVAITRFSGFHGFNDF